MDKDTLRELLRLTAADINDTLVNMEDHELDRLKKRFESLIADIEDCKEM